MSIDANELARLRAIAEAATPGPWWNDRLLGNVIFSGPGSGDDVAISEDFDKQADAEHIATFDPPTVLALLDMLAEKDAALPILRAEFAEEVAVAWDSDTTLYAAIEGRMLASEGRDADGVQDIGTMWLRNYTAAAVAREIGKKDA